MRKTRFVCISDTHNQTPKLPRGDVLVHAGDLSNQGSISELRKTVAWLEKADFEAKIVIAGNHDITLDSQFYEKHWSLFHNQHRQDPGACQRLFIDSSSITYLKHEAATIRLQAPTGPHTEFKVFGSPYSPVLSTWAFQYSEAEGVKLWDSIPLDTDVVVTHTPPKNHRDATGRGHSTGCEALRQALWRVRPRLAICGHIHEGRGVERVRWNLDGCQCRFIEAGTEAWTDPGTGNNKQSLVDLTLRGGNSLDNDGASTRHDASSSASRWPSSEGGGQPQIPKSTFRSEDIQGRLGGGMKERAVLQCLTETAGESLVEDDRAVPGTPDDEALKGRAGRQETCVINAAIMASSWGGGPKRFNKAIVVDIDLPVWVGTTKT
ncbi:Metallo-dependent phosphatase [Glonium stellatum]|uniref:Metallo-dependent phosphatase n=1 Tax=Glonium stellatum TaxID=574774 RepID=A0A8E2F1V8_9PEZI|nr:Metallo-dependent phosphatase [Glonium stellatum]